MGTELATPTTPTTPPPAERPRPGRAIMHMPQPTSVAEAADYCLKMSQTIAAYTGANLEAGGAIAMTCLMENLTPLGYLRKYHTIQGKPSMRADAMRAEFRMNYGGDFEVIEWTPDLALIKFIDFKGREYESKLTWEEAQKERWPWATKCGPGTTKTDPKPENLKDNWSTPLGRRDMLLARATSARLRGICPELVAGVYCEEELLDDIYEGEFTVVAQPAAIKTPQPSAEDVVRAAAAAAAAANAQAGASTTATATASDANVVDAEFTPATTAATAASAPTITPAQPATTSGIASEAQVELMRSLMVELFGPEGARTQEQKTCKKDGVANLSQVTSARANEIIERMRSIQLTKTTSAAGEGAAAEAKKTEAGTGATSTSTRF